MRHLFLFLSTLCLIGIAGCTGNSEPIIPDNPTPPPEGVSTEGLPTTGGLDN